MPAKLFQIGEFALIDKLAKLLGPQPGVITSIGDDTAVLKAPGGKDARLLFTTDMMVEDVHFTRSDDARLIGRKALGCNISDVAAMGGVPAYAVVSLGLPPELDVDCVEEIYEGMKKLADEFKVAIAGGDTVRSDKIVISVALLGEAGKNDVVLRSGAKPGDRIFVTGPLGFSLKTKHHLTFTPRVEESRYLVKNFKPTAMIDISDGLAADLGHVLKQSGTGAVLHADQIPFVFDAKLKNALYDGEDYELLFTLPAAKARTLMASPGNKERFHYIGDIVAGKPVIRLVDEDGREEEIGAGGFRHF